MKNGEVPAEIVAALIWNVPRLEAGSDSARHFSAALRGEPERWWEPREYSDDTLGRAARAVAHERAGELDEARPLYALLVEEEDPSARLLGWMLRAWSATEEGPEAIENAKDAIALVDPPGDVGARLYAKLATFSFDEGESERGRAFLAEAIDKAPRESSLRYALATEGLNFGIGDPRGETAPLASDPLVDFPWIDEVTLKAAQSTLAEVVEARARGLWSFSLRVGRTPLDSAVSAEVQATWAGALWLRRQIRKQLGAQLLTGAATSAQQWGYGVVMWTLGAGTAPERAYSLAEPSLDRASTDFIVRTLGEATVSPRHSDRFLSVAAEAWDAVSDEVLRWVIDHVEPVAGEHPTARESQRLWAGYAARLEDEWLVAFERQDPSVRRSLVEMLGAEVVRRLSPAARHTVFDTAREAVLQSSEVSEPLLRIVAAGATAELDDQLRRAASEKASATTVAKIVYQGHTKLFPRDSIEGAVEKLLSGVRGDIEDARRGTMSFGPSDVRLALARVIAAADERNEEGVELLETVATDKTLPGEHLLQARNGLTLVRRAGKLQRSQIDALHVVSDVPGTFTEHGDISAELLRIARLRVLAHDLRDEEVVAVVASCRARDARVRQIGLLICGEAAGQETSASDTSALTWALLGGLFDPQNDVVAAALAGLTPEVISRHPAVRQVTLDRLPRLLQEGDVWLRAAVSTLATKWSREPGLRDEPALQAVQAHIRHDRSWIVRTASTRGTDHGGEPTD